MVVPRLGLGSGSLDQIDLSERVTQLLRFYMSYDAGRLRFLISLLAHEIFVTGPL